MISYKKLDNKLVIDFYKNCRSVEQTALEFDSTVFGIGKILKRHNIQFNGRNVRKNINIDELVENYKNHKNLFKLSEIYNVTHVTIYYRLKNLVKMEKNSFTKIFKNT